jgi:peptide deformylase
MVRQIITEPNPILRQTGKLLPGHDLTSQETKKIIADLTETMYEKDGVGIAAPQIGESVQICLIAKDFTNAKDKDLVLLNPVWQKKTIMKNWGEEGCLSVPEVFGMVKRYNKIVVKYTDEFGKSCELSAENFFARIIQHEVDHLNGILFIDKAKKMHKIASEL